LRCTRLIPLASKEARTSASPGVKARVVRTSMSAAMRLRASRWIARSRFAENNETDTRAETPRAIEIKKKTKWRHAPNVSHHAIRYANRVMAATRRRDSADRPRRLAHPAA